MARTAGGTAAVVALVAPAGVFVVLANLGFTFAFAPAAWTPALSQPAQVALVIVGPPIAFVVSAFMAGLGEPVRQASPA